MLYYLCEVFNEGQHVGKVNFENPDWTNQMNQLFVKNGILNMDHISPAEQERVLEYLHDNVSEHLCVTRDAQILLTNDFEPSLFQMLAKEWNYITDSTINFK